MSESEKMKLNNKIQERTLTLSMQDTSVLKGVALLFLLVHHLFYKQNGLFDDISIGEHRFVVNEIGIWCKVCVAIFVFLSGYGLMAGTIKNQGVGSVCRFYWHRLVKLLMNYWLIWLLFVPWGVLVFGRTFQDAYGEHVALQFTLDFFGVLNFFGLYGYNATWWFYSCIIGLYLIFPFLYKLMEKYPLMVAPVIAVIYCFPFPYMSCVKIYVSSFALGMAFCKWKDTGEVFSILFSFGLFVLLACERFFLSNYYVFDAFLALSIVLCYKSIRMPKVVSDVLSFLGKHSMNIFLFHSFIYYYWFKEYIYYYRNPFFIFILLLGTSVVISIFIEFLKKCIRFDNFLKKIDAFVCPAIKEKAN